jgi:hypothetical protein
LIQSAFTDYSNITYWRVEYAATLTSANATGLASIIFKVNQLPNVSACSVDTTNGMAISTLFTISCPQAWDADGWITKFEFFGL